MFSAGQIADEYPPLRRSPSSPPHRRMAAGPAPSASHLVRLDPDGRRPWPRRRGGRGGGWGGNVRSLTGKAEELGGWGVGGGWPLHFKAKISTDVFFPKQQGRRNGF